jgi:hypothetical protein
MITTPCHASTSTATPIACATGPTGIEGLNLFDDNSAYLIA